MNLPIEIVIALLTMNGAFISLCAHLLIRVLNQITKLSSATAVAEARNDEKFKSLDRHNRRNSQETAMLQRHLGIATQPNHGEQHS